jgi:cytochrome c oxidase subunit 3
METDDGVQTSGRKHTFGTHGFLPAGVVSPRMDGSRETAIEDGGYGLPAGEDFPRPLEESSWWPFVAAGGAAILYSGIGLFLVGQGPNAIVPAIAGPIVIVGGVAGLLVGAFGWLYHGFIADYWSRQTGEESSRSMEFAMILFLVSDIATFSAGFVYYAFIRAGAWPPAELPELLSWVLPINTLLLGVSSITLHVAHTGLANGDRERFSRWLGATIVLGALFVAGQVYEYYELIVKEGFTITSSIFGNAFYGLTGLHGLHVAFGVLLLGLVFGRGRAGQYAPERDTSVVTVSMYWHLVDGIWFLIVISMYLSATIA